MAVLEPEVLTACVIEGYATKWSDEPNFKGFIVERGSFEIPQRPPPMTWGHGGTGGFGRWTHLAIDDYGLLVCGEIDTGSRMGRRIVDMIYFGAARSLSLGIAQPVKELRADGVPVIKRGWLHDICICEIPGDPGGAIHKMKRDGKVYTFRRPDEWEA